MIRVATFLYFCILALPLAAQVTTERASELVVDANRFVGKQLHNDNRVEILITSPTRTGDPWRFWIEAPGAEEDIKIFDISSGDSLHSIRQHRAVRGAWSPYLKQENVILDLPTTYGASVKLIGITSVQVDTQTPVGQLNLVRARDYDMTFDLKRLTKAVGQLIVLEGELKGAEETDNKKYFTYCTAFLIAPDRALTAEHCVSRGLEGKFSELVLGYLDADRKDDTDRHDVSLLRKSRPLDVALLKVSPPAGSADVFRISTEEPKPGKELLVLQHFGGEPLMVSGDADCLVKSEMFNSKPVVVNGATTRLPHVAFGHGCDTTKSSSGAPVIDRQSYEVVGLHQTGYLAGDPEVNRALRRDLLLEFLSK